jgi:hypothetical protein
MGASGLGFRETEWEGRPMFWIRNGRAERRKKVLDELIELEPAERRIYLATAMAAGDVREGEVESALLLVHRLDLLRVMTVPSGGLLPGGIQPIIELHLRTAETTEVADEPAATAATAATGDVASARAADGSRIARNLSARRARPGAHSSRQRRLKALARVS